MYSPLFNNHPCFTTVGSDMIFFSRIRTQIKKLAPSSLSCGSVNPLQLLVNNIEFNSYNGLFICIAFVHQAKAPT
eukprot:m.257155 g.257155  ORF g.257155 m.257155 type:complete len:75 (-) comp35011_c0_seq1:225-449(-)